MYIDHANHWKLGKGTQKTDLHSQIPIGKDINKPYISSTFKKRTQL